LIKTLAAKYEKQYKDEVADLPSKYKGDYSKIYKQRWENIKTKFDDNEIYTSTKAQQYLDGLVAEIVKVNPSLQNSTFQCYFSYSGLPNASYIGEGIILFNMGLFYRLNNESEAAFVICHELAHFLLKHSDNSMRKYVTTINSDEIQKELQKIKGSEFNKREQLEKLVKALSFSNSRHSRDHESQADSMAVELLHNTRFDVTGAVTTLALLDSVDKDTLQTASLLEQIFNSKSYPFQKKWIRKEDGLLGGHALLKTDTELEDSLKTHPDCKLRIQLVEPLVTKYSNSNSLRFVTDSIQFESFKNTFRYEVIEYAFRNDNYTRSFFYTLNLIQQKPADPYLVAQTGKILNAMFTAQKTHTLGKMVDLPSPYYSPNYNMLLQFVQNLYLENYASISYHFLDRFHPQLDIYTPFKNEYDKSIMIAQK
jgi:hypothetical protein